MDELKGKKTNESCENHSFNYIYFKSTVKTHDGCVYLNVGCWSFWLSSHNGWHDSDSWTVDDNCCGGNLAMLDLGGRLSLFIL